MSRNNIHVTGDPEKSDPRQSVLERNVSGRLKCFIRCSVAKVMNIFRLIFRYRGISEISVIEIWNFGTVEFLLLSNLMCAESQFQKSSLPETY